MTAHAAAPMVDVMRRAWLLSLVLAFAASPTAGAAWGPARTFAARHHAWLLPAVDARGDVAVLWGDRSSARVTLLAVQGRPVTRVLARRAAGGGTIVLDRRGAATAAWMVGARLYAAYGSAAGGWSAARLIARNADGPVLAVSPRRRVLLAWTNLSQYGPGSTGVAWRAAGRGFSKPVTLSRPAPALMAGEAPQSDLGATFDARGRAYLWGTCDAVLRIAPSGSRRLGLIRIGPDRALGFSFAIGANGRGLASWVQSRCTQDAAAGPQPGPLQVRTLTAGAFAPPLTLGTGSSTTQAFALGAAGSLVMGWSFERQLLWSLDPQGSVQSTATVTPDRMPLAADPAGDLLLAAPGGGLAVRPPAGTEEVLRQNASATAAGSGRRFAAVWDPDVTVGPDHRVRSPLRRLRVAVWAP